MIFVATIRVLPEVVAAVGGRTEVLMDGGIRRGSDIVKALCLGARAVLIGRAYAYGRAAAGGPGVTRAIDILKSLVHRGVTQIRHFIDRAEFFEHFRADY